MNEQAKSWQKFLKESALIFCVGVLFNALTCWDCLAHLRYTWTDFLYTGLLWVALWKGNEWVASFPEKYLSWKEHPLQRLLFSILGHAIYTLTATIALDQLIELIEHGQFRIISLDRIMQFNLYAVVIALVISLFMTARSFLFSWRDLAVQHEQLKAEAMASKFASLKAQVNPHFLFNSLNVLSGLVYQDADLSAQFIKKLSEVYRYVLDQQEEELVPIQEELAFVESVVFLQRIRFGENLHVKIDVAPNAAFMVAPMALQMLLENAIKHNVISVEQPLYIEMAQKEGYLVIGNSLQPKTVLGDSLGVGLKNIQRRYGFLTDKPVMIAAEDGKFIVKLPIIEL